MAEAFAIHIQRRDEAQSAEAERYRGVLSRYLEGARIHTDGINAQSTLSNCVDRETECTCEWDD